MRVKRWLMGMVLMLCITTAAHAVLPVAGLIAWLSLGTAAESAAGVAASVAVNSGIIAAFALSFWKKDDSNKPTGGSPTVTVYLNPSKARDNPDPTKFDNPAPGARDVTPKATTSGTRQSSNTPAGEAPPTVIWCQNGVCAGTESGACLGQSAPKSGTQGNYTWTAHFEFTDGKCNYVKNFSDGTVGGGYWGYSTKTTNNTTYCPGIQLTASNGKCPASNFPETGPVTCPEGYSASSDGTGCNLSDGGKVMKPDTQPCELLRGATGGLETDARNPNCKLPEVQVSGNSIQVDSQSISFNGDGSVSVANPDGQTTFQIGSYNSNGSANITGITRSGNPGNYDTNSPSTGGGGSSGGGGGGGGGSTGTTPICGGVGQPACSGTGDGSGGSCGGPGQAPCTIEDSGFGGKSVSTAAAESALDGINADRTNMLDTIKNGVIAPNFGWRPPVQNMACQPLEFGIFKGMHFTLNWCKYIRLMHDAISFLAYCLTALYLFGLLFGASKKEAR